MNFKYQLTGQLQSWRGLRKKNQGETIYWHQIEYVRKRQSAGHFFWHLNQKEMINSLSDEMGKHSKFTTVAYETSAHKWLKNKHGIKCV